MLSASADFVEIVVVRPSLKSGLRIFSVSFLFGLDPVANLSSKLLSTDLLFQKLAMFLAGQYLSRRLNH